ncbi:MAG: DUF1700 domain-containing protein [Bacillota bacterium]|nr:DUF1700 domain-containing protein [Bacillota bacterium]
MNRKEFIKTLRDGLSKLPEEEIQAAVEYYEEYFDEAGPEREAEVIKELGNPKKIAGQIRSEYAVKLLDEDEKPTAKKGLSAVWWVILGICSAPVSIPLAIALVILAVCAFITVFCGLIGIFVTIIGCILGAIGMIVLGFASIPVALSSALFFLGIGILGLGVLAALGVAVVLGVRAAINAFVRAARNRNERKRYEKIEKMTEENKWKYQEAPAEVGSGLKKEVE